MRFKKSRFFIWLILGFVVVSLGMIPQQNLLAKNDHSLTDVTGFIKADCVQSNDSLNCQKIKLEEKFSCVRIIVPSDALVGLSPKVSIAECNFITRDSEAGIYRKGCRLPLYNKYIVLTEADKFKAISTLEEFKAFFGPVETKEEALSFAVALTNSYPIYDVKIPEGYQVFVDDIEPTSVKTIDDGYQVRLFNYQVCGCGPHPYFAVDYSVSKEGEVQEISRQKIYQDPNQNSLCVD